MRHLYPILLHALLVLAATGAAADGLTVYCEYPRPAEVTIGSKGGLIHDEVAEMLRRAGFSDQVEIVTWKRGYAEVTSLPDVALFPTTRTAEREELFHWVGPILRVEWVFYALRESGIVITSLEDAKSVGSIGTYAQDGKEQWLVARGFTNLVSIMDNMTNMKKLYEGRIDMMVGSPSVTDQWPARLGYDPDRLVPVYTFKTVDLYLALSRGTPPASVDRLRRAFESMVEDGTVRAQYEKWVPGLKPPVGD